MICKQLGVFLRILYVLLVNSLSIAALGQIDLGDAARDGGIIMTSSGEDIKEMVREISCD